MIKRITKIGNSQGIIFDTAILELAHLKLGDELNLEIHKGGTLTLTPLRKVPAADAVAKGINSTVRDYRRTLGRLA